MANVDQAGIPPRNAPPQQAEPLPNYMARLGEDLAMQVRLNEAAEAGLGRGVVVEEQGQLSFGRTDYEALSTLLMLSVNGQRDMPQQEVQVEYLRPQQQMLVPTAIAMSPIPGVVGRAATNQILADRYWRASTLSYDAIVELLNSGLTTNEIMLAVDAMPIERGTALKVEWNTDVWSGVSMTQTDLHMGALSAALQFNCDIRDVGRLTLPDMCTTDTAWKTAKEADADKLRIRLRPYTILTVAALNMPAVANHDISAFVRAYGLALGLLPSVDSALKVEWKCVVRQPTRENYEAVRSCQERVGHVLIPYCANIISAFGLMHLAKDHTFRASDADMQRIATSYVQTLRVMVPDQELDQLLANLESTIRTGPHPFGISQSYCLALTMHAYSCLCSPLALRVNVAPPPVQRMMIADAARKEWKSLPAGKIVDTLFEESYPEIEAEIAAVNESSPSYSHLHKLYGEPERRKLKPRVLNSVQSMMPTVYGYVHVTHTDGGEKRDGLAYALSLQNVLRDQRGLATLWANAWGKYLGVLDEGGLAQFVESMRAVDPTTARGGT